MQCIILCYFIPQFMYLGYASLDGLEKINRPMCALPKEREELLLLEDRHVQYFRGKYQSTREWGGGWV